MKRAKWNSSPATQTAIRLLKETLPSRWKFLLLSLICMIGVAGFTGALAYSTKLIVNDVFVAGSTFAAWQVAALVVFISVGRSGFGYANSILRVWFDLSISAEFQKLGFEKIIYNDVRKFQGTQPASHMAKLLIYGRACGNAVINLTNEFMTHLLTLIVLIGVMVFQDPIMSLFCSVLFPLIFFMIGRLTRRIRVVATAETLLTGEIQGVGTEAIEGIKTVKSYGLETKTVTRFSNAVTKLQSRMNSLARMAAITMPVMELLGGITLASFVVYASWQTTSLGKTPGEFTAFITAFLLAYQPAERLSKIIVDVQKSLVQVEEMYGVLDAANTENENGDEVLEPVDTKLTLENVSFAYGAETDALQDVSFQVQPGERVAIVGRSGAGKTTLIDLLQGFYAPSSGKICVGDKNIADVKRANLRANIAYISQDVFLFDGSIRENIADGNPGASDQEIETAARLAQVETFANALQDGLDTQIGPNGGSLSGGQKQRIGIARALVKHAKIYIYDEATSALDGQTERAIMEAAIAHAPQSIVLFVTHRPSTLQWVDRVLMLDAGKVAAFETHDALTQNSEAYRALFNLASAETA